MLKLDCIFSINSIFPFSRRWVEASKRFTHSIKWSMWMLIGIDVLTPTKRTSSFHRACRRENTLYQQYCRTDVTCDEYLSIELCLLIVGATV